MGNKTLSFHQTSTCNSNDLDVFTVPTSIEQFYQEENHEGITIRFIDTSYVYEYFEKSYVYGELEYTYDEYSFENPNILELKKATYNINKRFSYSYKNGIIKILHDTTDSPGKPTTVSFAKQTTDGKTVYLSQCPFQSYYSKFNKNFFISKENKPKDPITDILNSDRKEFTLDNLYNKRFSYKSDHESNSILFKKEGSCIITSFNSKTLIKLLKNPVLTKNENKLYRLTFGEIEAYEIIDDYTKTKKVCPGESDECLVNPDVAGNNKKYYFYRGRDPLFNSDGTFSFPDKLKLFLKSNYKMCLVDLINLVYHQTYNIFIIILLIIFLI